MVCVAGRTQVPLYQATLPSLACDLMVQDMLEERLSCLHSRKQEGKEGVFFFKETSKKSHTPLLPSHWQNLGG